MPHIEPENGNGVAVDGFLEWLGNQIDTQPNRLRPITSELRERMQRVSAGVDVDIDEEIEGPVSL